MPYIPPSDLFEIFRSTFAKGDVIVGDGSDIRHREYQPKLLLGGIWDVSALQKALAGHDGATRKSDISLALDLVEELDPALSLIWPDDDDDHAVPGEVTIVGTLDFELLALALYDEELARTKIRFVDKADAKIVYLINVGQNYYPGMDNTVAIREDIESAEAIAAAIRESSKVHYESAQASAFDGSDWVKIFPQAIGAVPIY